jgi:alginate O-acetyltransferase complex protein AlgI
MVFTTHLFIFYYLSLFLLLYYAPPFRARTGLIALFGYIFSTARQRARNP